MLSHSKLYQQRACKLTALNQLTNQVSNEMNQMTFIEVHNFVIEVSVVVVIGIFILKVQIAVSTCLLSVIGVCGLSIFFQYYLY